MSNHEKSVSAYIIDKREESIGLTVKQKRIISEQNEEIEKLKKQLKEQFKPPLEYKTASYFYSLENDI